MRQKSQRSEILHKKSFGDETPNKMCFVTKFGWKILKSFVFLVQTYHFSIQNKKYGVIG